MGLSKSAISWNAGSVYRRVRMAAMATDVVLPAVVIFEALAAFALAHGGEVRLGLDAVAELVWISDLSALWGLLELTEIGVGS